MSAIEDRPQQSPTGSCTKIVDDFTGAWCRKRAVLWTWVQSEDGWDWHATCRRHADRTDHLLYKIEHGPAWWERFLCWPARIALSLPHGWGDRWFCDPLWWGDSLAGAINRRRWGTPS